MNIQDDIQRISLLPLDEARLEGEPLVTELREGLNNGRFRAAEKIKGIWHANPWVKQGILLAFRLGVNVGHCLSGDFSFRDKNTLPLRRITEPNMRVVPGGSSIRDGVFLGSNVICMPPMFINIGAWIGEGTMIDSHALVGSCAQIGERVHVSAAAQIGGVLEPTGALPVIIEDDVFIGGNCGIYESVIVGERAVLGSGVILTSGVSVYDTVKETVYKKTKDHPLMVPPGAVVVAGSRPARGNFATGHGLSIYTPIILKYRDDKTDSATALEETLR